MSVTCTGRDTRLPGANSRTIGAFSGCVCARMTCTQDKKKSFRFMVHTFMSSFWSSSASSCSLSWSILSLHLHHDPIHNQKYQYSALIPNKYGPVFVNQYGSVLSRGLDFCEPFRTTTDQNHECDADEGDRQDLDRITQYMMVRPNIGNAKKWELATLYMDFDSDHQQCHSNRMLRHIIHDGSTLHRVLSQKSFQGKWRWTTDYLDCDSDPHDCRYNRMLCLHNHDASYTSL